MLCSKLRSLRDEQTKTAQQLQQSLTAQAQQAQTSIAGATQVAIKTAKEIQTLSDTARHAEYTAKLTAAKVEDQVVQLEKQMQEQRNDGDQRCSIRAGGAEEINSAARGSPAIGSVNIGRDANIRSTDG